MRNSDVNTLREFIADHGDKFPVWEDDPFDDPMLKACAKAHGWSMERVTDADHELGMQKMRACGVI